MRTKTTTIMNKKLGKRRTKRMTYEEPAEKTGALQSAKKHHQEELDRRGQSNSQKKQQSGEKGALEKEHHNHEKELGKIN